MMHKRLILLLCILLAPVLVEAQLWSGIIDTSRAISWQTLAGVEGGIPTRSTICSTLSPGATAAQINSAIAVCPSNQTVKLNAGTYNLAAGITFNGKTDVTLRGAGPDQTKLVFTGTVTCNTGATSAVVCLAGSATTYAAIASPVNWTAGYVKGTTQITLSSASGLSVGQIIVLDQCNDGRTGASCTGTEVNTGDAVVCQATGVCAIQAAETGDARMDVRMQQHIAKITSIAGNVVTIDPPLYMPNWRDSQTPQAWSWGTAAQTGMNIGIEDLSVDYRSVGSLAGIAAENAWNFWIYRVRGIGPTTSFRTSVWLYQTGRGEIRDSYFFGRGPGSSASYGIETFQAHSNLIVNNIIHAVGSGPYLGQMGTGNVFVYNHIVGVTPDGVTQIRTINDAHNGGNGMNLTEGNDAILYSADTFHGSGNFGTAFRNFLPGFDPVYAPSATNCTQPVTLWAFHRYYNIVGNVLGSTARPHTVYESDLSGNNQAIYNTGDQNPCGSGGTPPPDDSQVRVTLMRWGNYDVVTNTNRFVSSEVPSALANYANPVPGSQTLPASFLYSSRPSWFGFNGAAISWPSIGPDVTGGDVTGYGGRVSKIPARRCFESLANDGANAFKVFTPGTCYQAVSAPPSAPTNLRITHWTEP